MHYQQPINLASVLILRGCCMVLHVESDFCALRRGGYLRAVVTVVWTHWAISRRQVLPCRFCWCSCHCCCRCWPRMAQSVTIGIAFGDVIIYSVNCTPPPWHHRLHNTSPTLCPIMGRTRSKKHRLLPCLSVSMFLSHTAQPLVIGVRYMQKAAKKTKNKSYSSRFLWRWNR